MTLDDMVAEVLSWRFRALPNDVLIDIMEANGQGREFAPAGRGLKRIWKEMRGTEKALLLGDYDGDHVKFGPDLQDILSAKIAEAVNFDRELFCRPNDIKELYTQTVREQSEAFDKVRSEFDETAFFNEPEAKADFSVWVQMPIWSVNEATALSLGKSPDIVTPKAMKAIKRGRSHFAQVYAFRRTAIKRAVDGGHLEDPMPHADFLRWAAEHQMSLPQQLAVVAASLPEPLRSPQDKSADRRKSGYHAAGLKREDNSLYKMIAGMAIKHYKCNNKAMIPRAVTQIMNDVIAIGHNIDDQTVRTHLNKSFTLPTK